MVPMKLYEAITLTIFAIAKNVSTANGIINAPLRSSQLPVFFLPLSIYVDNSLCGALSEPSYYPLIHDWGAKRYSPLSTSIKPSTYYQALMVNIYHVKHTASHIHPFHTNQYTTQRKHWLRRTSHKNNGLQHPFPRQ